MSQIANGDVAEAVDHFDASETGDAVLTLEQVREFAEISGETDVEVKAQKISEKIESLLAEVESGSAQLNSLLSDFGIEDGQVEDFLSSDRFDPSARGQLQSAIEKFQKTTLDQATSEAQACAGTPAKSTKPRANRRMV